ncbi:MAG: DNA helicase RecQ [Bacteroidetes bacterium]|nr:DNA helicase RecQ [Bacteroidota bacterium]
MDAVRLGKSLRQFFGFAAFKGLQEDIILNIMNGKDSFVIMPTGGGKSLCYQLPAIILDGTAIVVSPLIALMKNQVDAMRGFVIGDSIAHFLNSSLNKVEAEQVKRDVMDKKTKLLYLAPETLNKAETVKFLKNINVSFVAIDEAHCISEWGHDFRPEYRRLRPIVEAVNSVPIIALTATATPKVQQDIQKNLDILDATVFKASFNRPNLYYEVRPKVKAIRQIIKYIKQNANKSGIIYCLSRKKTEEIAETLRVNNIKALAYHAGMESDVRSKTQDKFLMEDIDVIVATIAFGMGIDKPDVRFIIHYDMPKSLEGYYQETGRSGRDGGEGRSIAFYDYKDIEKLEKFTKGKPIAEQEVARQLLLETVSFAETAMCRRKFLLHYFGEKYEQDNCGSCDNCIHPKEKYEVKKDAQLAIETVLAVKEKFKAKHVVNVIMGKSGTTTRSYKHDSLEVFGAGGDNDEKHWNGVIRQCLVEGLLVKEIENYGLLKVSPKGFDFLKKPYSLMIARDLDYEKLAEQEDDDIIMVQEGGTALDAELFAMLKDLCKAVAKQHKLPPYVIFQESSLSDMATQYPITVEELKQIQGVGPGKAEKFGKKFVEMIATYVRENEIQRPKDMVVKSVVNRSGLKVFIIHSIDRKVPLNEITNVKSLTMDDLLDEIESIVMSGTKINIDYYINTIIDEDRQQELIDYFRKSETGSVENALKDFNGDYEETEVRFMRIKFISHFGN